MNEQKYQRLTRERAPRRLDAALLSRSSLWLGPDHLLLVGCTGYTETYKRFYFRDIQAITLRQTKTRAVWNWILGIAAGLCLLAVLQLLTAGGQETETIVAVCFLALFTVPLVVNNLFGPTCSGQIRTAVQTEELASLVRVRSARRVLDKIRPLIVAAQGQLAADDVVMRMQEAVQGSGFQIQSPQMEPRSASPKTVNSEL